MNIVNRLTRRQLWLNKKRTLVTIIGVIISAAMITAVSTFAVSFLGMFQQETITMTGEWHVQYNNVQAQNLSAITQDSNTKFSILSRDIGYSRLKESQNEAKPYLFLEELSEEGLKQPTIKLLEGRLPQSSNEVLISEHILTNGLVSYKVGDTLTLELGQRTITEPDTGTAVLTQNNPYYSDETFSPTGETRTVTITGIIERPNAEEYSAPGYTIYSLLDPASLAPTDPVNVSVCLKDVSRAIYDRSPQIAKAAGMTSFIDDLGEEQYDITYNRDLLRYYGVTANDLISNTVYSFALIIILIIMVGSIALIYNAFAISISERSRYLGMLASVGATKGQKRRSVFYEGFLIGLISIPLGILFGILGMGVTFLLIQPLLAHVAGETARLTLVVSPLSIAASAIFSVLTIFISAWLPARKASRISPIDAIRQTKDIKLKSKTVKTSKLTRKIFGFEAELALKNLKRNKKRYRSTIFSLIISIILFLATSFYVTLGQSALNLDTTSYNYDVALSVYSMTGDGNEQATDEAEDFYSQVRALPTVTESTLVSLSYFSDSNLMLELPMEDVPPVLRDILPDGDGIYEASVNILSLDDESLQRYANQCGIDYNLLAQSDRPAAILLNKSVLRDNEGRVVDSDLYRGELGSVLTLTQTDEYGSPLQSFALRVAGTTDIPPMGMTVNNGPVYYLIVSNDVFAKYIPSEHPDGKTLYLSSTDPNQLVKDIESIQRQNLSPSTQLNLQNLYELKEYDRSMMTLMQVFVYGFVILITLICVANIFNTISTSISLRSREFAMLKSVGMTPKGFNRMIRFESLFYGIKALLYAIPLSFLTMLWMYYTLSGGFGFELIIPWTQIVIVIVGVFLVVSATMLYSGSKVKKQNIIDTLKQENI